MKNTINPCFLLQWENGDKEDFTRRNRPNPHDEGSKDNDKK